MWDVINDFPTAGMMAKMGKEDFELYFFEIDLRQALQMIAAGASGGVRKINYMYPNTKVLEFLEDKGYIVTKKSDTHYVVAW